jgi:hypothetical protein
MPLIKPFSSTVGHGAESPNRISGCFSEGPTFSKENRGGLAAGILVSCPARLSQLLKFGAIPAVLRSLEQNPLTVQMVIVAGVHCSGNLAMSHSRNRG